MKTMRKQWLLLLMASFVLAACGAEQNQPAAAEPPQVETAATPALSAPVVMTATNTYVPLVEAQPPVTPTLPPTIEATAVVPPTPTPLSPIGAVTVEPVLAGGLQKPTFITHAGDDRLFVLEQVGRIRIFADGKLLERPFLDITDRVGSVSSEQGLLGLAFHPDFARSGAAAEGQFYVNYTDYSGHTHISRFSLSAGDPNAADKTSEVNYLTVRQPYPNHNGGSLAFGPDGYLYAGLGDGGSANDPLNAGQSLNTLLGKVLRLDVDEKDGEYAIPPDNPFAGNEAALPEIWAYGLRNPWRFAFDRATGDLYIADVGQNLWEEVNFQPAASEGGENYGWRIMEASHCFEAETCDETGLVQPIFEYDHSKGCSITGGHVYRGQAFPEMLGNYFVADYCTGTIWRLFPTADGWLAGVALDTDLVISTFGEDVNGEVYLADYVHGAIYQLQPGQ